MSVALARRKPRFGFRDRLPHSIATLLLASCTCSLAIIRCEPAGCAETSRVPNVVLLLADDLGWGDTGFNGHPVLRTPELDAMAKSGLTFTRFYAAAPVCSPTRGSCLTGRHPYRYGVFSANVGHMPPQEITLAEALKTKGYATGHFGKWHLGTLSKTEPSANRGRGEAVVKHFSPPWKNGFDECFSTEAKVPTWDPLLRGAGRNTWWDPVSDRGKAKPFGTPYFANEKIHQGELPGDDSRAIMDRALPFIQRAAAAERPFLAVIWFHAPHLPVVAGREFTAPYADRDKHTQHYYGCIAALDKQVGRLRRELRRLGVADDTMLWFCADNGPEGSDSAPGTTGGFRGRKRSLYEGGVRVPAVLEWPARVKSPGTTDVACVTSDYYPTVLEAVGITLPDQPPLDGMSLLRVIDGKSDRRGRAIGFQSGNMATWVDHRHKLVVVRPGKPGRKKQQLGSRSGAAEKVELYDLLSDPRETKNLAAENPTVVKTMRAALDAWRASCAKSLAGADRR